MHGWFNNALVYSIPAHASTWFHTRDSMYICPHSFRITRCCLFVYSAVSIQTKNCPSSTPCILFYSPRRWLRGVQSSPSALNGCLQINTARNASVIIPSLAELDVAIVSLNEPERLHRAAVRLWIDHTHDQLYVNHCECVCRKLFILFMGESPSSILYQWDKCLNWSILISAHWDDQSWIQMMLLQMWCIFYMKYDPISELIIKTLNASAY